MNPVDVAQIQYEVGFRAANGVLAVAIIGAETAGTYDPLITNSTGNEPSTSVDRGLWQINSHWHAEVSDACAFDAVCASREAFRISNEGTNFNPWSAFKNDAYKRYMLLAGTAWEAAKRLRSREAKIATLETDLLVAKEAVVVLREEQLALEAEIDPLRRLRDNFEAWVIGIRG